MRSNRTIAVMVAASLVLFGGCSPGMPNQAPQAGSSSASDRDGRVLVESESNVYLGLATSRDGRHLAWADMSSLSIYSIDKGRIVARVDRILPQDFVEVDFEFSPDGELLLYKQESRGDYSLEIRDAATLTLRAGLSRSRTPFQDACFTPDGSRVLLAASESSHLWNFATGETTQTKSKIDAKRVAFASDTQLLAVNDKNRASLYSWPDAVPLRTWPVGDEVGRIALSRDGRTAATFRKRGSRVCLWNVETGEVVRELLVDRAGVEAAALSADGKWVLSVGYRDIQPKVWSVADGSLHAVGSQRAEHTWGVVFDPETRRVYFSTGLTQASVTSWDVEQLLRNKPVAAAEPTIPATLRAVPWAEFRDVQGEPAGFLGDGRSMYVAIDGGDLTIYRTSDQAVEWRVKLGYFESLAYTPDGRRLAVATDTSDGGPGSTVTIWDVESRKQLKQFRLTRKEASRMTFSPDGNMLAVSHSPNAETAIWDVERETRLATIADRDAWDLQFSADGKLLAFALFDMRIGMWDAAHGKLRWEKQLTENVLDLEFAPDGKRLVVGLGENDRGGLAAFDIVDGTQTAMFDEVRDLVRKIAFAPDGRLLAVASVDRRNAMTCRFWSLPDSREIRKLQLDGTPRADGAFCFSADGKYLLDGQFGTTKLWRLDQLLDDSLQRDLVRLVDRGYRVTFTSPSTPPGVLHIEFPSSAGDREVENLPAFSIPFALRIHSASLTDEGIAKLARHEQLAHLELLDAAITDQSIPRLLAFPRLKTLSLQGTKLTPAGVARLKQAAERTHRLSILE